MKVFHIGLIIIYILLLSTMVIYELPPLWVLVIGLIIGIIPLYLAVELLN